MRIVRYIKKIAYFWVASYFAFFARIYLNRWKPHIITVIGSSGKTTLLHLLASELQDKATVSYHANSAFGIPFHILGLQRKSFRIGEWFLFFILTPLKAFRPILSEKIYVTEADAERPYEAHFLAKLLKPETVVWLSLSEAHGSQYDHLDKDVRKVMAHEFGYFVENTTNNIFLSKDNPYIAEQATRSSLPIHWISSTEITDTKVFTDHISFSTSQTTFDIPTLLPREAGLSVIATSHVLSLYGITNPEFKSFVLPPGRSSVLKGIRNTTIIDSSYNGTIEGMRVMLDLMEHYPSQENIWLVVGDMIEQGKEEVQHHIEIAKLIQRVHPKKVILVGPRLQKNTYPLLDKNISETFLMPHDAYKYLEKNLTGGEVILFKGARYLEGIVEKILENPADAAKLCRREQVYVEKRKQWGL